ncbi:MAG: NifB/NifX family molybdenum-iron cluster-binding protein, partial [Deltaproteobacteria bacterium]|nr:NifB/NifX family molybdenum-iron cluster-binding protein [Deltaproteobacteria bacterium]
MKIAFPVQDDRGMESQVYSHFGSARLFIMIETEGNAVETIVNQDMGHRHGQCKPLDALGGHLVDAVVVWGIGGGALRALNSAGVKVYRAVEGSIQENLELTKRGVLPEFTIE